PTLAIEDVPTPDYCLGFYDSALTVDLPGGRCTAISWSGDERAIRFWRDLALKAARLRTHRSRLPQSHGFAAKRTTRARSNFTKPDYLRAIERIKDYIAAGDCYQVNLSQRFEADLGTSPWELYKTLRRINPAPHSCFIEIGELVLVSASPESFLSYNPVTRTVTTRPIKGTRPRGSTPEEDARLEFELAASEKDRAENLMIVDMERNDLGRVARYGSVRVPKLWEIEVHPNVFQMVSTVEAELAEDRDQVDLLRASFPGGSITGAPKVRAMEIIEELEPHRRGIYTGSAGFIDFSGRMELNIVIRSFVVHKERVYFHAGGGIVADSDPEMEYQETLDKVSGLMAALEEVYTLNE
ncbi:MAG: aminodeoxychorismate synthase component I, partial [Armatimonadetes bacterium]|nr:aminodeoxychorismate synthase component I [Armatimonadota bacterium]